MAALVKYLNERKPRDKSKVRRFDKASIAGCVRWSNGALVAGMMVSRQGKAGKADKNAAGRRLGGRKKEVRGGDGDGSGDARTLSRRLVHSSKKARGARTSRRRSARRRRRPTRTLRLLEGKVRLQVLGFFVTLLAAFSNTTSATDVPKMRKPRGNKSAAGKKEVGKNDSSVQPGMVRIMAPKDPSARSPGSISGSATTPSTSGRDAGGSDAGGSDKTSQGRGQKGGGGGSRGRGRKEGKAGEIAAGSTDSSGKPVDNSKGAARPRRESRAGASQGSKPSVGGAKGDKVRTSGIIFLAGRFHGRRERSTD